jgi:hypothetical protein
VLEELGIRAEEDLDAIIEEGKDPMDRAL